MRIALWDIETAKMQVAFDTYSRKMDFIPSDAIKRHIWLVCASWQFLHQKTIKTVSVLDDPKRFKKSYFDDFVVVKALHELMESVDVLVAHNGDNFDWKMFLARCAYHGLKPPPRPLMVDTLKVARSCFKFEANDLRYLARFLGVSEKGKSPDWALIATGDAKEIKKCAAYNRQDIITLEGVYLKLRPFMKNHPNVNVIHDLPDVCPTCASPELISRGYLYSRTGKKRRFQCKECGAWGQEIKSLKTARVK